MLSDVVSTLEFSSWALVSLGLFLLVFIGALFWIFRKGAKEQYEKIAQLPLDSTS